MFAPPGQGGVGPSVRMGHRTLWASTSVGASTLTAYAEKTYAARAYAESDSTIWASRWILWELR